MVQDTDLLSTVVYCRHYFGRCPEWIEQEASTRKPDLYLLCAIDLAWEHDGIRDRGHAREAMQALFRDAVEASGVPFVEIRGEGQDRTDLAIEAIEAAVGPGWSRSG